MNLRLKLVENAIFLRAKLGKNQPTARNKGYPILPLNAITLRNWRLNIELALPFCQKEKKVTHFGNNGTSYIDLPYLF